MGDLSILGSDHVGGGVQAEQLSEFLLDLGLLVVSDSAADDAAHAEEQGEGAGADGDEHEEQTVEESDADGVLEEDGVVAESAAVGAC